MSAALAKKLLIKPDCRVRVFAAPPGLSLTLPAGASLASAGNGPFDVVLVFAPRTTAMVKEARRAARALEAGGVLWLCYPKQNGPGAGELTREVMWDVLPGWRPVTQVAVDRTWSAMRFRPATGGTR